MKISLKEEREMIFSESRESKKLIKIQSLKCDTHRQENRYVDRQYKQTDKKTDIHKEIEIYRYRR